MPPDWTVSSASPTSSSRIAAVDRRQPQRGLPHGPGRAAGHGGGRGGRIVNISSSSTHSGAPYMAHYVAAKSAVNGLTKSLALEYGPDGITVNAVPPGSSTPRCCECRKRGNLGDIEKTIAATPVRRIGRPEESRRPAPSWCPRMPATSPVKSWALTAAETPSRDTDFGSKPRGDSWETRRAG